MRDWLYALGSVLGIVGWILAAIGVYRFGVGIARRQGVFHRGTLLPIVGAVCCFLLGVVLAPAEVKESTAFRFPIVWPILPFSGWAAITCLIVALITTAGSFSAIIEERRNHLGRALAWAVGSGMFWLLFFRDEERVVRLVKGSIPLTANSVALISFLVLGSALAMGVTSQSARFRGWGKTAVQQAALLGGSFVFCIPLFFLLSTSFKEDRDMSSASGMIWIPKVQQTVPYMDPKQPLFEGNYEGQRFAGTIIGEPVNGNVRVDVSRPFSIRGKVFEVPRESLKEIPRDAALVTAKIEGTTVEGQVLEDLEDGRKRVLITKPATFAQQQRVFSPEEVEPIRKPGLRYQNYTEALEFMPVETQGGWVYLRNTLVIVALSVIGTILSSSLVAYAFSRLRFPWRDQIFALLLATMMLPGAVTMMPKFLIFRSLGWVDTLYPLWAPAFFASAFNVFMLRQFFKGIPMELEDAAKVDGCSYAKTFWSIMLPQIMPALSVIFIWTFTAAWNDFQGPLIYINSPENMPLSYALQLFSGDRSGEPGLMMAFATMTVAPVLLLFFAMQRYFIEGVTLSGFGGR